MIKRLVLAPVVAMALLGGLGITGPRAAITPTSTGWAQDQSDLKPDPRVRYGRLANGMRYALMRNATPAGQTSFRLRFAAGSLMERDEQQGLAHFLEHMAFNGSTHVPTGEMVKILERLGLAFGADTNASTAWTQTVYKLDLPRSDSETVDTSLVLLREIASELKLPQKAVDSERGVVLSEERVSDTPNYQAFRAQMDFVLADQLAARRLPIGKVAVIQTANRDLIEDLYDRYYRPERATLVAVGDFNLDTMESKVKARFGDWRNDHPAGPDPDLGGPLRRGLQGAIVVEPGVQASLQVGWVAPPDLSVDTRAKRRRELLEQLGFAVMNRRLETLARGASPPFVSAGADREDEFHSARVTSLDITPNGSDWRPALTAAMTEQRRLIKFGVLQAELDREIEEERAALQAAAAAQSARRTPALANKIAGSLDSRAVVTDPAQDLEVFTDIVAGLKADAVSEALRKAFEGQGPLVFLTSPVAVNGGAAVLKTTVTSAERERLQPPAAIVAKAWPYERFGAPGAVAEQRENASLGATFIRFANGVGLTIKPTHFRKDQILVEVRAGNGRQDLPKDRPTAAWARGALIEGGLQKLTAEELDRVMTSKIVGASFDMDDTGFVLSGATKASDLANQMQLLTAYVAEPGFRPAAFDRLRTYAATLHDQFEATPGGVISEDLPALLRDGDPRWTLPSQAAIAASRPEDLAALLTGPLAHGPLDVIVVGDVTVDQAEAVTAATFGALRRPANVPPALGDKTIAFPPPRAQPMILPHNGRADQAVAVAAWPTADFFSDPRRARVLRVMVEIMKLRMIDDLRVAQGSTYSPSATLEASQDYPGYGYVAASAETPPAKLEGFFSELDKIGSDLRARDVGADELQRAVLPRIEAITKAMQTNEFWLSSLVGVQADPRRGDAITSQIAQLQSVTPADIRQAAQAFLRPEREWKLQVVPRAIIGVAQTPKTTTLATPGTATSNTRS